MTWHEVSLKQICGVDWGNTKLTKSSYVDNGKFLAVSAAGADGLIDHYEHEADVPVLSAIGAQCGRMFYPGERFTAIKNTITLTPKEDMADGKFLYYLFTHVELPQRGAGQPFISKGDIEAFRVSIPESLEEQRKIVEKLDSAFAEITSLEENLISRAGLLEQLLQGALSVQYKSAIDNTANSMRLGEIADFQGGSQPAKSNFLYKEQKGYVRFIQIRDFGSDKNLTYIPIATKNRLCTKSDILIGRYGASVGKILTGLDGAYNVALMKVIPKNEIVDRDYLYFYLLSEIFQTNLLNVSDRSAQNGFSKDDISGFPVIIPSLREQKEIVAKLAKVRNDILEINLVQLKTKTELALLRKSLLSNALTQEEAVA
jgi:type I restriction enzyme S subunit